MACSKLAKIVLGSMILGTVFVMPAQALDAEQKTAIVQNCTTIKSSLEKLQRVDSRTRTYLGTTYEMLSNRFIIPLNLRLVNNNRPTLGSIQSDFTLVHYEFRSRYTSYMRDFDALLKVDCAAHPDDFYAQLVRVRERRAELKATVDKLHALTDQQVSAVSKLKDSL